MDCILRPHWAVVGCLEPLQLWIWNRQSSRLFAGAIACRRPEPSHERLLVELGIGVRAEILLHTSFGSRSRFRFDSGDLFSSVYRSSLCAQRRGRVRDLRHLRIHDSRIDRRELVGISIAVSSRPGSRLFKCRGPIPDSPHAGRISTSTRGPTWRQQRKREPNPMPRSLFQRTGKNGDC